MAEEVSYDVCLSFAGSERDYVEEVAGLLRAHDVRVFYDAYETVDMWGDDLHEHLVDVYRDRARFCVLFASADYARRVWTTFERRAAQDRAIHTAGPYLLPVLFDDAAIPGLHRTTACVDARTTSPAGLVRLLLEKLGRTAPPVGVPSSVLVLATDEPDPELDRVLDTALARCRLTLRRDRRRSTDRRVVAVVPESVASVVDVVTALVPAVESVARERGSAAPGGPLRVAVHCGQVIGLDGVDVAGAVDAAASAAVGDVLSRADRARCAVAVSQRVWERVVERGRGGSNPAAYQRIRLPDGAEYHVRVQGYPKPPPARGGPDHPRGDGGGGNGGAKSYYFHDKVDVGRIGDTFNLGDGYRFGSADGGR
ncbi:TIR domain-containing protein [Saccharothrix australiensis]|uniref:TIR domain-containing protein n=1 Tax=Saccharothrix australiensis TaxID=2072 RepID=A0A495W017_9PSEU|nr:TIR domain-containing protein [Saccharothrix australiensis]RKT54809.1 TIR domain-containing protein [Saccharothrix australiensis]